MIEINEDDVRNRLESIRTQIKQAQTRLDKLHEEERDLEVFLRVVQRYAADLGETPLPAREAPPDRPAATPEAHHKRRSLPLREALDRQPRHRKNQDRLKRDPEQRQTQIARDLIRTYKPGVVFSASDVAKAFGNKYTHPNIGTPHYLSSYLNREAQTANGILERIEGVRGNYRLKANADQLVVQT